VIPNLQEIAHRLAIAPSLVALAVRGVLTAFVLLAQSIARRFDVRDS
jgi:hypothetical protein